MRVDNKKLMTITVSDANVMLMKLQSLCLHSGGGGGMQRIIVGSGK